MNKRLSVGDLAFIPSQAMNTEFGIKMKLDEEPVSCLIDQSIRVHSELEVREKRPDCLTLCLPLASFYMSVEWHGRT